MFTIRMFRLAVAIAAALPVAIAAQPANAQSPGQVCELHVWPAERVTARTIGLLSVFVPVDEGPAQINRDASIGGQLASALDSQIQLDALRSLDLIQLLGLPAGTTVIPHETPFDWYTNRIETRSADSPAQCYYELITAEIWYRKVAIDGRSLRTMFVVRDFGNDQRIDFEYQSSGSNGLSHFPPREGADAMVGLNELVDVFKRDFVEYANNARQALARRSASRRR